MKQVLATFIFCFILTNTFAQNGSVSGRIISDKDGSALPYVHVLINEKTGTQTNEQGYFIINNLTKGTYQIKVRFIGFEDYLIENVLITADNEHIRIPVVKLIEKSIQIKEVTVSQHKTGYDDRYASSNNIVSKNQLEMIQPVGTEEVLKLIPGVTVAGDMGISNRLNVGIRGSYPRRSDKILVLEDGTPVAPAPYLAPSAYYNPPSERLDGIEVIKGAEVLTYGPNNIYGVINYITRRPPLKPTFGASFTAGNHRYLSGVLSYGGTWNNVGAELQVLAKNFDGFINNSQSKIFNTTAKVYADLGKSQSFYVKVNYHHENSLATYSAITPLTFQLDPEQNPFDADELITTRYAIDLVHNLAIGSHVVLNSKIYGSQFRRDWWRQNSTVIKATDARNYLGDDIYFDRFSYLEGESYTDENYVRVGKIGNGRESTKARNRLFNVGGLQETAAINWVTDEVRHKTEGSLRFHTEKYNNQEISNDSSRFARSGRIVLDDVYHLYALSGHIKHSITFRKFGAAPALRMEYIVLNGKDLIETAADPNNTGDEEYNMQKNTMFELLPGVSFNYRLKDNAVDSWELISSIYKGYTPPTSEVGFLYVDEESNVSEPADINKINIKPETSLDVEGGTRFDIKNNGIAGQLIYFFTDIHNFYSAGREEAFETLGRIHIHGIEGGTTINLHELTDLKGHALSLSGAFTYMNGKIKDGTMKDDDLLKVKHTATTKEELISMINNNQNAFDVYFKDQSGNDSLVYGPISGSDFSKISNLNTRYGGENGLDNKAPYIPDYSFSLALNYEFKGFGVNLIYNRVGSQYTEYLNFENESGEGAIGKLSAFHTMDATLAYSFRQCKNEALDGLRLFLTGKNLFNDIYRASRLHRVSSGIFPGGFVQVMSGLEWKF